MRNKERPLRPSGARWRTTMSATIAPEPDVTTVPRRVNRATAAQLVTQHYFPTTPRALQDWPVEWLVIAGKATCETSSLFAVAQSKLDAARSARAPRLPRSPSTDRTAA
jgi:hypothetical protein